MNFFAYGSLRPGGALHGQISSMVHGQCEAVLEARLFVFSDGYPIVVDGEPAYPVVGTLLDLPDSPVTLQRLDEIEGVRDPRSPYQRVQRRVHSDRGDEMAWVYLATYDAAAEVVMDCRELDHGDWFLERPPQRS